MKTRFKILVSFLLEKTIERTTALTIIYGICRLLKCFVIVQIVALISS